MLKALEDIPLKESAKKIFDDNLKKQEANITEPGEKEATTELRKNFNELLRDSTDIANYPQIRQGIQTINDLNQQAILQKSAIAKKTADDANFWLSIIFSVLTIIAFTLVVNFPGVISNPVRVLADGISEIANKNYTKRIYLDQHDEFGDLAKAFNTMAANLDEYENSNLAHIKFEKSRIEIIINQMKDGIIGLDETKHVLFLNAVAEKLLGLKEKDILGKYAADIALKNDLMRTLMQENEPAKELKIYADNKESYFDKDVLNVTSSEAVIGSVIVLRNITPFHELNEAKTNFIATVSHELKTPVSSIKMSAQLLSDNRVGELNTEQKELISGILEDTERLLKITGELLNMSQVETGNIQLKLQQVNPAEIIELATQTVQLQAQQKNIALKINIQNNLPAIYADEEKTSWVLINLLTNAVKYSNETSAIEVYANKKNDKVEFAVKDFGKGIDEKYLPKIFNRYYKVPGTHERSGTGLGLAISKEFIEAQGGEIKVESEVGVGSTFSFFMNSV